MPFEVIHNLTTADAPETIYHVRKVFRKLELEGVKCEVLHPLYKGQPTSMWALIPQKLMPPTRTVRYCCHFLKEGSGKNRCVVLGVRRAESQNRSDLGVAELPGHTKANKDDPEKLQNFVNSWLAEPWEDTNLKTSADMVLERQTHLPELIVPAWGKLLTGGVDVQENCVYWTIRAWGNHIRSQNIAHGQALSLEEVERIMNLSYQREDGGEPMVVNLCLVDSGDQTDMVYDFCAANSEWALPSKGASTKMYTHYRRSKVNKPTSQAYGMDLILVDTGKYKDMIAGRMRKKIDEKGSWTVYAGCDREYAEQVTAEHKVNVKKGGRTVQEWVQKHSHGDNHYLDCEVGAMCAADILDVRFLYLEDEGEKPAGPPPPPTPEEEWIKANENWI